jgi:hypothetical protein
MTSQTSRPMGSETEMVTHSRESRPIKGVVRWWWCCEVEVRVAFEIVRRRKPSAPVDDGVSPSGDGGIKAIFRC